MSISCCYFPTTPMLVDDDPDFIKATSAYFSDRPSPLAFLNPKKAIDFIIHEYKSLIDFDRCLTAGEKNIAHPKKHDLSLIEIDIFPIHKLIYNPNRFKELAVIFADHSMPQLTGINFFKLLANYPFQKILLTGQATKSEGLEAFNARIINQFIEKGSQIRSSVNAAFNVFEKAYFQGLSSNIIANLSKCTKSCLGEPKFEEIFNKVIQENNIVEYYLVSKSGCFLMLDFDGTPSWFVAKSEDEMAYYYQSALDNNAPSKIVDALKSDKYVLFLYSQEDDEAPYDRWESYLHPAETIEGNKNKYYFTYIQGKTIYNNQLGKFKSYKNFLEQA